MADNQAQTKKKKSKKKSESKSSSTCSEVKPCTEALNCNSTNNLKTVPNTKELVDLLAPKGIEVTLVQPNKNSEESAQVVNNKKKKKSKKSKAETKEEQPQTISSNNSHSFLNFTKNGILLANNPEISVTLTSVPVPKLDKSEDKDQQNLNKEENKAASDITSTSKKKKKKNKKKVDNNCPPTAQPPTLPASSSENTNTVVTPTYTKVVTGDNTTLLLVNNDNLAAAAKTYANMEDSKSEKMQVRFIQDDKKSGDVLITKNLAPDAKLPLNNAVSIFPVLPAEGNIEKNSVSLPKLDVVQTSLKKDEVVATNTEAPTKAQLKAERRAKQEAQRAAKQAAKANVKTESEIGEQSKSEQKPPKEAPTSNKSAALIHALSERLAKTTISDKDSLRKVRLFSHLPEQKQIDFNAKVHPAILEAGSQYNQGIICGSNARCIALLAAFKEVIQDFKPQPGRNLCRELESTIQSSLTFINNCRPLSVSMNNAVKLLKHQINHIPSEMEDDKAKSVLCKFIDNFVNEEILLAKEAIGLSASEKIVDGDVILVFSHSSLVKHVLFKAHYEMKNFRVIVADSRPKLEGLEMLRCLVKQGIHCSYILINAVSYVMKEVTKVIIGAHALLANGCVMSRLGSKQIALVASSYSVPVLVCCETYKFCERALTDSFVHNELGEPNAISATLDESNFILENWKDVRSLQLLNLLYDVTPSELISMVVTEKGVLPCTSVPVVLRVRYAGLHE